MVNGVVTFPPLPTTDEAPLYGDPELNWINCGVKLLILASVPSKTSVFKLYVPPLFTGDEK